MLKLGCGCLSILCKDKKVEGHKTDGKASLGWGLCYLSMPLTQQVALRTEGSLYLMAVATHRSPLRSPPTWHRLSSQRLCCSKKLFLDLRVPTDG